MRGTIAVAIAVVVGASLATRAGAGGEPPAPQPFPVAKTTILRDEKAVYFVEGRQTIPKGVEVTALRGIRIEGRGKDPTIVVEGNLKIHGVQDREVLLDGVTVEPARVFDEIKMSQTVFRKGGGIRTAKDVPTTGYFMLELMDFAEKAVLDVEIAGGTMEFTYVCAELPVRIRAVDDPTTKGNTVRVEIRGCVEHPDLDCQAHKGRIGLRGGLDLTSANEIVVRLSRLGGALAAVRDWRKRLIFDGNKVDAKRLEITQPAAGRFRQAQFFKCDVWGEKVLFSAPPLDATQTEEVQFERWFFARAGGTDKASVMKVVEDGSATPDRNGVRVKMAKLNERPLELAGPAIR